MNNINAFFSNPDIPARIKLVSLSVLFGGTYSVGKRPGGQEFFQCEVGKVGTNRSIPIYVEKGVNYSLSTGSCVALLKAMSVSDYFKTNADRILKGDCNDEEILNACKEEIKERYNSNDKMCADKYKNSANGVILGVKGKLEELFKECVKCGDLTSEQRTTSVESLLKLSEDVFTSDDKKKQITAEMPSNN